MTVQWLGIEIDGTNETKLKAIRSWLVTNIQASDLADNLRKASAKVFEDDYEAGVYHLRASSFIKGDVDKAKYKTIIKNQLQGLNKTGIDRIKISFYDDCSHDSNNPQPCSPTKEYEYTS